MGLSPTVAMASRSQRSGKTFTEVYADYVRLQEDYARKSAEYDHMDRTLSAVLAQIEERVRMLWNMSSLSLTCGSFRHLFSLNNVLSMSASNPRLPSLHLSSQRRFQSAMDLLRRLRRVPRNSFDSPKRTICCKSSSETSVHKYKICRSACTALRTHLSLQMKNSHRTKVSSLPRISRQ